MTEEEAFQKLKVRDKEALAYVYQKNRLKCIGFATRRFDRYETEGIKQYYTPEEALDLYHDAIIILVENIANGRLVELKAKFSTYIIATMKNKWKARDKKTYLVADHFERPIEIEENDLAPVQEAVRSSLDQLDKKCREMLSLRYFMDWDYTDIANVLNYKKNDVVRNLIARCKSKFKDLFSKNYKP